MIVASLFYQEVPDGSFTQSFTTINSPSSPFSGPSHASILSLSLYVSELKSLLNPTMAQQHQSSFFFFFYITFLFLCLSSASMAYSANVSYDSRSLIINGQRKLIISASIHYPRSVPAVCLL